jgi:hypothetical protein
MPRRMSFMLTIGPMQRREKTETMRLGWKNLKPGDVVIAIEKGQGLKKGEKHSILGRIEIVSNVPARVDSVTEANCIAEGFPELSPAAFVAMFCRNMKCRPSLIVRRIRFKHL